MRNILVVAYQLHYSAGSECAVAMDFARNMGKCHHITMLYGTCRHFHQIGNTREMEEWTECHSVENVRFIPVMPSFKSTEYGYSMIENFFFYRKYRRWHEDLRRIILNLMSREKFDLIHYLGPIGYHEPGYMGDFGVPVIWGPIGGFETVNLKLVKASISYTWFINTAFKNIVNKLQYRFDVRVRKALNNSDAVIFAVSRYVEIIQAVIGLKHKSKFLYLPENGISNLYPLNECKFDNKIINLVFIGHLDGRKALYFILAALKLVQDKSFIKLHVLGTGPLESKYKELAKDISDIIEWHGLIPREEVFEYLNNSHLMVIPSVLDANTTVVWEAMSAGVPILAFDHCGFHDTIIDRETGFLIRPSRYRDAVKEIAGVLDEITRNPQMLRTMAQNVIKHRENFVWDKRIEIFNDLYDSLFAN